MSTPELRTRAIFFSPADFLRIERRACREPVRTNWEEVMALLDGAEALEGDLMTEDIRCKVSALRRGVRLATSEDDPSI